MKGGQLIGKGTWGCVFAKPGDNYVRKIVAEWNKTEISNGARLLKIDPENKYGVYPTEFRILNADQRQAYIDELGRYDCSMITDPAVVLGELKMPRLDADETTIVSGRMKVTREHVLSLLESVAFFHEHDWTHNDVSLGNVGIYRNRMVLIDWSLATHRNDEIVAQKAVRRNESTDFYFNGQKSTDLRIAISVIKFYSGRNEYEDNYMTFSLEPSVNELFDFIVRSEYRHIIPAPLDPTRSQLFEIEPHLSQKVYLEIQAIFSGRAPTLLTQLRSALEKANQQKKASLLPKVAAKVENEKAMMRIPVKARPSAMKPASTRMIHFLTKSEIVNQLPKSVMTKQEELITDPIDYIRLVQKMYGEVRPLTLSLAQAMYGRTVYGLIGQGITVAKTNQEKLDHLEKMKVTGFTATGNKDSTRNVARPLDDVNIVFEHYIGGPFRASTDTALGVYGMGSGNDPVFVFVQPVTE